MCTGFWSFNFNIWRRRHVVKPSSSTRKVDLAETEVHIVNKVGMTRAESPVHMDETVPVTLTFPHPYEKIVRRYPSAPETTPQTDDQAHLQLQPQHQPFPTQPDNQRPQRHATQLNPAPSRRVSLDAKSMRRHTTPILMSHRPPVDQLDLDLAHLSGDDLDNNKSKVTKPFSSTTIRPLPKPPVPVAPLPLPPTAQTSSSTQQPSSLSPSPSTSRPAADRGHSTKKSHHNKHKHSMHDNRNKAPTSSGRKRAATITTTPSAQTPTSPPSNFAKEKYYHRLPPSARYLADIARYPNCVDPIRPWNVLKDDHGAADVKYTNDVTKDAEEATPQN